MPRRDDDEKGGADKKTFRKANFQLMEQVFFAVPCNNNWLAASCFVGVVRQGTGKGADSKRSLAAPVLLIEGNGRRHQSKWR